MANMDNERILSPTPSHLDLYYEQAAQIEEINSRQMAMESSVQMMTQALNQVTSQLGAPASSDSFSVKVPDVEKYDGSPSKYVDFLVDLQRYFDSMGHRYNNSSLRLNYVFTRLVGAPRRWMTALFTQKLKGSPVPELEEWSIFMDTFKGLWSNRNQEEEADAKLHVLQQGNANIKDHITNFEAIRAESSHGGSDCLKEFLFSLKPTLRKELKKAALGNSALKSDYNMIKNWLLGNESINVQESIQAIGDDPMDISQVSVPHASRGLWTRIPAEIYKDFKDAMIKASICPSCRDYVAAGHSGISQCKLKNVDLKDLYGRDNKTSTTYLLSFESPEQNIAALTCPFKIHASNKMWTALVDTGALGSLFIANRVVEDLPTNSFIEIEPVHLRSFSGEASEIVNKKVRLTFHLGGHLFTDEFLVLQSCINDVLIGWNWLKRNGVIIDCKMGSFKIHKGGLKVRDQPPQRQDDNIISSINSTESKKGIKKVNFNDEIQVKNVSKWIQDLQNKPDNIWSKVKESLKTNTGGLLEASDQPPQRQDTVSPKTDIKTKVSKLSYADLKKMAKKEKLVILSCKVSQSISNVNLETVDKNHAPCPILPHYLKGFEDVFDQARLSQLPRFNEDTALRIKLKEGTSLPKSSLPYSLSSAEDAALREILFKSPNNKIVQSMASNGCPVLFIKKPDGSLRMCVDYRSLNAITDVMPAILPNIADILSSLDNGSGLFSKIDLKNAFHQLRMHPESEDLTTFVTKYGRFKYKVVPFGISDAPGFFQSQMNRIFSDLYGCGVWVYIDDILIYEKDRKKHRELIKEVVSRLRNAGLVASLDKCVFEAESVQFLGFNISESGISLIDDKLKPILEFPRPKTAKQIQSFLGVCNFYRSFISKFSLKATPLYHLLKKNARFEWSRECEESFNNLKESFRGENFLAFPDRNRVFRLACDASDYALGAVLSQEVGGVRKPVGFYSRKLQPTEMNYPIHDKELLSIKAALEHWRHLLIGTQDPIEIHTDHKNLVYFSSKRSLNRRQSRWQEFLSDYNFKLVHIAGEENTVPDALSRREDYGPKDNKKLSTVLLPTELFCNSKATSISSLLINHVLEGVEPSVTDLQDLSDIRREQIPRESLEGHVLEHPEATTGKVWPIFYLYHLKNLPLPETLPLNFKSLLKKLSNKFKLHKNSLLKKISFNKQSLWVPYLQERFREYKMKELHEVMGHLKSPSTFESLRLRWWWPAMEIDYKRYISTCHICQMSDAERKRIKHPMHSIPDPGIPFHTWHIDWIQDLPASDGYKNIAVATDKATRITFAKAFTSRDGMDSVTFVHLLMCQYGAPSVIVTDRASAFLGHEFQRYCSKNGILHFSSTSYHPNTNGLVERVNGVLESILRKLCAGNESLWSRFVGTAVLNLNVRKHTVTGFSPFYLAFGFNPRLPGTTEPPAAFDFSDTNDKTAFTMRELSLMGQARAAALYRSNQQAKDMAKRHDSSKSVQSKSYQPGEFVKLVRKRLPSQVFGKFEPAWEGPFIIEEVGPNDSYRLKKPNGELLAHPVNFNHLSPYKNVADLSSPAPEEFENLDSDSRGGDTVNT